MMSTKGPRIKIHSQSNLGHRFFQRVPVATGWATGGRGVYQPRGRLGDVFRANFNASSSFCFVLFSSRKFEVRALSLKSTRASFWVSFLALAIWEACLGFEYFLFRTRTLGGSVETSARDPRPCIFMTTETCALDNLPQVLVNHIWRDPNLEQCLLD